MSGRQNHQGRVSMPPIPQGGQMLGQDMTADEREQLNNIAGRAQSVQYAIAHHQGKEVSDGTLLRTADAIHHYVMEGTLTP